MNITTILFDLDGTLLPMDQEVFTTGYFKFLAKKLAPYGYEPKSLVDAIWAGTAAMVKNDGSCTNEQAFWKKFAAIYGEEKCQSDQGLFEDFYANEFNAARDICGFNPASVETVHKLKECGYRVALATNPIFPHMATENRIRWAGLVPEDFEIYTTYEASTFCKPNPAYYLEVARTLGVKPEEVAVSSTGRIGVQMPMATIERGIDLAAAALSDKGGPTAAEAIMTTDTVPKSVALQLEIGGKTVTIGAMTKGAGMIDPAMTVPHATMLCYITTDVKADNALLRDMIGANVADSFNRITVDGDMSTNDTTIVMANGLSGIELKAGTPEAALFQEALLTVMQDLARRMVMDGEGATKFVTVKVVHSRSKENAKLCAEAVANSLLCKTAWFGGDPNWGRVVAALGYSGATFDPDKTDIYYDGMPVVRQGGDAGTPESALCGIVKQREFTVLVDQNEGDAEYWVWTSDISYEYVKINADYHT